jgi:hypothetical protein
MPTFLGASLELGQRVEGWRVDAAGAQEIEQAFAPPVALGQQQHAVGVLRRWACSRASGSSAPRRTVRSGNRSISTNSVRPEPAEGLTRRFGRLSAERT